MRNSGWGRWMFSPGRRQVLNERHNKVRENGVASGWGGVKMVWRQSGGIVKLMTGTTKNKRTSSIDRVRFTSNGPSLGITPHDTCLTRLRS